MTGISSASVNAVLTSGSFPCLEPKAILRSFRSSDLLQKPEEREPRALDPLIQKIYDEAFRHGKALALLQSCSKPSYISREKVTCPVFAQILELAQKAGLREKDMPFLQYHIIGGKRYVFVGDNHANGFFRNLEKEVGQLAVEQKIALFVEATCGDPQSEKDFRNLSIPVISQKSGETLTPWIFGLEGEGRSVYCAVERYVHMMAHTLSKDEAKKRAKEKSQLIDPQTKEVSAFFQIGPKLTSFLYEGLFNSCWDRPFSSRKTLENLFTPNARALFRDMLDVLGENVYIDTKNSKLFPELIEKHGYVEIWRDFFWAISRFCLDDPQTSSLYTSFEKAVIEKLLENPQNEKCYEAFFKTILLDHRDRVAAKKLFVTELPKGAVRVVWMGYKHLAGVVQELQRLTDQKNSKDKNDQKKA